MKTSGWILGALVVGGVVFTIKGGCLTQQLAPDERLAEHFDKLCDIAKDNVQTPERGVRKLGHYLDKHVGQMLHDWGETLATVERIADDSKHDARARVARDRLRKPLYTCARDWMRFGDAVEADPKANALVQRFSERLNRTFEIILGDGAQIDFARLPQQLENAVAPR